MTRPLASATTDIKNYIHIINFNVFYNNSNVLTYNTVQILTCYTTTDRIISVNNVTQLQQTAVTPSQ